MPGLKEIAGKSGNKNTQKNKVIRHISMLFIRAEKRPSYVIINQIDWNYLTSLPGIQEYLEKNTQQKLTETGMLGTIWSTPILLVNETDEVRVYHKGNIDDMRNDFPENRTLLKYTS